MGNLRDLKLNVADTIKVQWNGYLGEGKLLLSDMGRVLMSYGASMYVRFILAMPVADTTAGFKCYTAKVLRTINLDAVKFMGYAFQIEMKYTAWRLGFKIVEVPIIFTDRTEGTSKMSSKIFKEAFLGVMSLRFKKIIPIRS